MSLAATGSDLGRPGADPDLLLARYRALGAQEPLFDLGGAVPATAAHGSTGYDEMVDSSGAVRPAWRELAGLIAGRGREGLTRLRGVVRSLVDNDGIIYNEINRHDRSLAVPTAWQLDGVPLLVSAQDWDALEAGVVQRARLLDAVLADLCGERRSITSGILPPQLLFGHPGYLRAAHGIGNPGRHQLFLLGCDVSRAADGAFAVNADRTQAPSGVGYALADRRVVARTIPEIYERIGPRPSSPFAQALRLALIDAAPATAEEPAVVVLSPGIHSETAFDQAYLATVLGFPLVESADLVVREGALWMRSLGTLKRVDVVLRRLDAEYADPLDLRPDSRLGVAGLLEAQRRGTVTVVNTLGSGILESPAVARFLPELAELLLGEPPLLGTPRAYWGGRADELAVLRARLGSLVIRSAVGSETLVGPSLSAEQRGELLARIEAQPWQWVGQELPQFSSAPTGHFPGGLSAACVGMRLFTVSQRSGYAAMVGALGYVLAPEAGAFRLKSVAAKDVWILPPAKETDWVPTAALPAMELPGGTQFISSPRVLADMFWIGRYAERTEDLARLLIVTRERYHEFHYRLHTDASECLPVLLAALGRITGAIGVSPDEAVVTGPQTLRSLTVDPQLPGSLAHSVERLVLAARAVRDQMSSDTWMILGGVERALAGVDQAAGPDRVPADDTGLAAAQRQTLNGMLALSGVTAESMVHDPGWLMMDIGKRIERAHGLAALLRATITVSRAPEAERTITESALVACESSVIYRRLNLGRVSVRAVAELVLFDEANPRSLAYQLDRLRRDLRALPGASGSSRAERLAEELAVRLRRLDPAELGAVDDAGRRAALDDLLAGMLDGLAELSDVITATQLTLPGEMQPLWGPGERRMLP
jgi:uncharacterized circularly permuted ATP-grasp superfamily protein/uncharacterized alpha-E superfamily protein